MGMKRLKEDEAKLEQFLKNHALRLLKIDMITVLIEFERQGEVALAFKIFRVIQKESWYKPDIYLYKDMIIILARSNMMDEVIQLWEDMRRDNLFPDSQTYIEVIRGFLRQGLPGDAMNIYEDMLKSTDPLEDLPFRILLQGLEPHPLLKNRVEKDFKEIFPECHVTT